MSWDAAIHSLVRWYAAGAVICLLWTAAREGLKNQVPEILVAIESSGSEAGKSQENIVCLKLDLGVTSEMAPDFG